MAETSLRAYIHQLEGLLSQQAFEEVIAHCRHILDRYPKHLDTYRILGKALLEKGQHQDAADIFLRVLSADPSDFIAHVGLSIIYEEDNALDPAIWHMERAFEVAPNNDALQDELRRLYGQREGHEPTKLQLTRGALARLYAKGVLYQQAMAELTKGIAEEPDRVDLLALLAETLWNSHQEVKAGEVAARLLERLPYCLQANRILGELWLKRGDPKEAQPFLARVEALDPYLALEIRSDGKRVSGEAITIPSLPWTTMAVAGTDEAPDWVSQLGAAFDERGKPTPAPEGANITDIFKEAPAPEPHSDILAAPDAEEAPDWLASMAMVGDTPAATEPPVAEQPQAGVEAADVPDWLGDMVGDMPAADELPADLEIPDAGVDVEEVPDWLMDIAAKPAGAPPPSEPAPPAVDAGAVPPGVEEDVPDWLAEVDMGAPTAPPAVVMDEAPEPKPELELKPEEPVAPLELEAWDPTAVETWESEEEPEEAVEAKAEEEVVPDWLAATYTGETADAPVEPARREPEGETVPDWLQTDDTLADESSPGDQADEGEEESMPDWLAAEMQTPEEEAQVVPSTTPPGGEETPEEEMPNWMKEGDFDGDDAMAWLESLAAKQGADPSEFVTKPSGGETPVEPPAAPMPAPAAPAPSSAVDDELSWLREPTEEAELEAAAEAEEEIPDWLMADEEPVAEAAVEEPEAEPAEELPDWLKVEEELEEAPAAVADEPKPELEAEPEAEAEPAEELPDWLMMEEEPEAEVPEAAPEPEPVAAVEEERPAFIEEGEFDSEEALSWLEDLAVAQGADPSELITEELKEGAPAAPSPPEAEEVPAAEPGEVPDWLLAEAKPAAEEEEEEAEPIAAAAPPEAEEVPDWLLTEAEPAAEEEEEEAEPVAAAAPPEAEEVPDWLLAEAEPTAEEEAEEVAELDWLTEAVEPEAAEEDVELADFLERITPAPEPEPKPAEEAEAELPEWLRVEAVPEEDKELAEFLSEAEPAAPVTEAPPPPELAPPPPPERVMPPPPPEPAPTPPPERFAPPPPPAPVSVALAERLTFARENLANNRDAALDAYQELVSAGEGLEDVIKDLSEVVEGSEVAVDARVSRLLGDALMAKGRVQEALDAYRGALDRL